MSKGSNLIRWQAQYLLSAAAMLPAAPALYLLGQYTRRKVGVLPGPAGEPRGRAGGFDETASLLVIGESTVAGVGASTHEAALGGQFAARLSRRVGKSVEWTVIGKNGVTARQTIEELVPLVPKREFDYILIGLGGNDVMKLSSPVKWRRDMSELIAVLRKANPNAVIFITNCPMIKVSPAIPQPIKAILWQLSRLHDANIREFASPEERVFYYHQPRDWDPEGFFADGIHPSEKGYAVWSDAMIKFFDENYRW